MHTFDQWFSGLNTKTIAQYYHGVGRSSLVYRLYDAWLDDQITLDDAVSILHHQWVSDANLFAAKLLEQTIQGVQYTVWHEFLANNTGDRGN